MDIINIILIYILIMVMIYLLKPDFLYDNTKNKFKEFGYSRDKSIIALPVFGIILAIAVFIGFNQ